MKLSKIFFGISLGIASAFAAAFSGLLANSSTTSSANSSASNAVSTNTAKTQGVAETTPTFLAQYIAMTQQEIDRLKHSEKQSLTLPDTGSQNDSWSCGPNSAARVLKFYGHDVDYDMVRAATEKNFILPEQIKNPLDDSWVNIRTGTTPKVLQKVMQRWEGDRVKLARKVELATLLSLLETGKPVIGLIRVGSFKVPLFGTAPYLHWVALTGFDRAQQQIYYTDTNSQESSMSYEEFLRKWNLGSDGNAVNAILKGNGVEPRTIVWVDRKKEEL
ncbi:C39 family peptidase [Tumidithrix elongata RA019]|uniref:C39 family peptidase n=1 Tax=Tumidithrix elongata BACA0141 TaxID=2716417 RepID=A0AAW9PWD9_9CYAN|nr:C39 family peptidase [Tumidithrix elongata RA019]